MLGTMHREDVVATIRKRHGSVAAFERCKGFFPKSVNEVLRGRANAKVRDAIEEILAEASTQGSFPEGSGNSAAPGRTHRLNAGAR